MLMRGARCLVTELNDFEATLKSDILTSFEHLLRAPAYQLSPFALFPEADNVQNLDQGI